MINYNKIIIFLEKYSVQDYLKLTDLLSEFKIEPILNNDETELFIDLWKIFKLGYINKRNFIKKLLNIIRSDYISKYNILIRRLDMQDYTIKIIFGSLTGEINRIINNVGFYRVLEDGTFCFVPEYRKEIFNDFEKIFKLKEEVIFPIKAIDIRKLKIEDLNLPIIINKYKKEFIDLLFEGIFVDNKEVESTLFTYLSGCDYFYSKI